MILSDRQFVVKLAGLLVLVLLVPALAVCADHATQEACETEYNCGWDGEECVSTLFVNRAWNAVESVSSVVMDAVGLVLGRPDIRGAAQRGVTIPQSDFAQLLLFYVIPIAGLSSILKDVFLLFGLFRRKTAMWMGVLLALMGARVGVYVGFVVTIGSVFGGFVTGMFGLLMLIVIMGYLLSHVMLGYRHAIDSSKLGTGQEYLQQIGEHVEGLSKGK